jgi:hypothetical protein
MSNSGLLPNPPTFSQEEISRCRETGDYAPILFEWYKFVGSLNVIVAHIQRESPAFRAITPQQYHVLIGLLNRCARLMLANVALSHEGRFGETTAIVDRCIFETGMKIIWLCRDASQEKFVRYLADGLRTELEFKAQIESNIASRGGEPLPIESRMLRSIGNHIASSGLVETDIDTAKRLPDLASMIGSLGYARLTYIVGQRMGSHHVHGTWSSLLMHYLEERDGAPNFIFQPRAHDCETHINQYMFVPRIVLDAMTAYVQFAFNESLEVKAFVDLFESTETELMRVYEEAIAVRDQARSEKTAVEE